MPNILLGVTGSVAAIKTPELFAELRSRGHAVRIVATPAATYFFDPAAIEPLEGRRNRCLIIGEDLGTVPDFVRASLSSLGFCPSRS